MTKIAKTLQHKICATGLPYRVVAECSGVSRYLIDSIMCGRAHNLTALSVERIEAGLKTIRKRPKKRASARRKSVDQREQS